MSGTGKSTVLAELRRRGYEVVETDEPEWMEWSNEDGGYVWREDRLAELLARGREGPLFVSGTVSNQGRFYPGFDAVVLLSAPLEVLLGRIEHRTTNDFGKTPAERERIRSDFAAFEHRMRATCTHELDATQPIENIVAQLIRIGDG
jgi:thymidylate kinase